MFFPFGKRARRQRLAKRFPPSWLSLLHDNVLFYRALPEAEQARLRAATTILVAEKNWEGCAGQVITDEVKVTIAGQAGVLLLGLGDMDGALADLDRAAKLDPQDPAIRRLREEVIAARRESGA
jgi:Mlc titration factor MtfA (ptsG expression regulator)